MNPDYDRQLEAEISRELKELPELDAPAGLAARVMARIEQQSVLPWYRQSWDMWPAAAKVASLALFLAMFGGLCFGLWQLPRVNGVATATRQLGAWFSGFNVLWDTLRVLAQASLLVVKKLGPGFMAACVMLPIFSYLACVGVGTILVRYARARR